MYSIIVSFDQKQRMPSDFKSLASADFAILAYLFIFYRFYTIRRILSPLRLPIPPLGHYKINSDVELTVKNRELRMSGSAPFAVMPVQIGDRLPRAGSLQHNTGNPNEQIIAKSAANVKHVSAGRV